MSPKEIVERFWQAMQTNDFHSASQWLSCDYELTWPQSSEKIVGPENFAVVNTKYPANGLWHFTINTLLADGNQVVSDVSITDGKLRARAITFSTVANEKITKQVEFWPDSYAAPEWRRSWVVTNPESHI